MKSGIMQTELAANRHSYEIKQTKPVLHRWESGRNKANLGKGGTGETNQSGTTIKRVGRHKE